MKKLIYIALIFAFSSVIIGQNMQIGLKRQALQHMRVKKYGEAIDLLNKYISSNAQEADAYNLRGICHWRRGVYPNALFDFRRAKRLDSTNPEYAQNEAKLRAEWNPILYDKIEGHKREIAINPRIAFNYLEIGKAYRWLEEWLTAEEWYDRYLARDDNASPDEVIRYTLILMETGHIKKGEIILKKYCDRYPGDWRLWSRYGYFTMWLGNYKNAEEAFLNALSFKPYFKEAQDGLDQARRQGYLMVQHEGSYNRSYAREYPIDRYYRIVNRDPENTDARFYLTNELINADRYEEAYDQLKYLRDEFEGTDEFDELWETVSAKRVEILNENIVESNQEIENNPFDRDAVTSSANYNARLEQFDDAATILDEYLMLVPDDYEVMSMKSRYLALGGEYEESADVVKTILEHDRDNKALVDEITNYLAVDFEYDVAIDLMYTYLDLYDESEELDIRYKLVKYHAWNYDWEDARENAAILLKHDPDNLEYQLLSGQIIVWTVDEENFPVATLYFENVLGNDKQNLYALVSLAYMRAWQQNLPEAKKYLDIAKWYHGTNSEIQTTENFYNAQVLALEEMRLLKVREAAGHLILAGDCEAAIDTMDYYFSQTTTPESYAYLEYASALLCQEKYSEARHIYDSLLTTNYDFEVDREKARSYIVSKDTLQAVSEFERLYSDNPDDFYTRLYLGDSYMMAGNYGDAEELYSGLLEETNDDATLHNIELRLNSIPAYGMGGTFGILIPYNFRFTPSAVFYNDNQLLQYHIFGGRVDFNLAGFLGLGAGIEQTTINSGNLSETVTSQRLTNKFLSATAFFSRNFSVSGEYGLVEIEDENQKHEFSVNARFDETDLMGFSITFERDDVRRVLYSQRLIGERLKIDSYMFNFYYVLYNSLKFETYYRYNKISDGNLGNDFIFKLGRTFNSGFTSGYEYLYSKSKFASTIYYSPTGYDAHSIWGEWNLYKKNYWDLTAGAKVGYSPSVDFVITDVFGEAKYNLLSNLFLQTRVGIGNSSRFDARYMFFNANVSLSWNFL